MDTKSQRVLHYQKTQGLKKLQFPMVNELDVKQQALYDMVK
jgi:hypothetical protein